MKRAKWNRVEGVCSWRFSYSEDENNKAGEGDLVVAYWIHVNPWNMEGNVAGSE